MSARRVVITGLGVVSPFGEGIQAFWGSLCEGKSAITQVNLLDNKGAPPQIAAPVVGLEARNYVADRKLLRIMCRSDAFGLVAAQMAINESGAVTIDSWRKAAFIGTGKEMGPVENLFEAMRTSRDESGEMNARLLGSVGRQQIPPLTLVTGLSNGCLFAVSVLHNITGSNTGFLGSGEVSLSAIGAAYHALRDGDAEWALAGGHDSGVDRWAYADFHRMGMLTARTDDPAHAVRPFDKTRDGFALGEGAGMVVLEEAEFAQARGARIWGEIIGYAAGCDAAGMVAPNSEGAPLAQTIATAITRAGTEAADIDYVNAYASATRAGDLSELRALTAVFGQSSKQPLVSAIKGATGHLLAASGAVEFIATVLALNHQTAPPTVNLTEPDPECHFDCVPKQARAARLKTAMTLSRGIGGQSCALVLRSWDQD